MAEAPLRWAERLRNSAWAFALAAISAGLMLAISELGYLRATGQLNELVVRGQARLQLSRLVRRVADAESSQRGYLLTGSAAYLAPYRDANLDAQDSLVQLEPLLRQAPAPAQADLQQLAAHVRAKLSETDEVLALYNAGRQTAARELLLTGIGRDEMASVRQLADRLIDQQNALVATGLGTVFDTLLLNRLGVATMTAVSLLVLVLYLRQRRQTDDALAAQQRLVQAERDRLEEQVQHRTAELTNLARHLETAREDERARLARDLHDELGALLTTAKLDVARLRPQLVQAAPDLVPRLAHLVEVLNSGIALKRRIIEDLRPSSLTNLGLLSALEILCAEFAERLDVALHTQIEPVSLSPSSELTAFRLVQESLNNIAKHAQARQVAVSLHEQAGQVLLSVVDDGRGFDTAAVGHGRHGLVGMRYRVQAEGGQLQVSATPGQGTQVRAWLPTQPG